MGQVQETEEGVREAPEVITEVIEELEHECDFDEDGYCPVCGEYDFPNDFSGAGDDQER